MHHIRGRYKSAKAAHKKSKQELRALRSFFISHYTLLALSTFDVMLAFFATLFPSAELRGAVLILSAACSILGLWILLSSIEK